MECSALKLNLTLLSVTGGVRKMRKDMEEAHKIIHKC